MGMNRQALNVTQSAPQSCPAVRLIRAVLSHTAAWVHGKAPLREAPAPYYAAVPSHPAPLKSRAAHPEFRLFLPPPPALGKENGGAGKSSSRSTGVSNPLYKLIFFTRCIFIVMTTASAKK